MSPSADETESRENADFRAQVRGWIAANKPAHPGFKLPQSFLEVESERQFTFLREWQRKVFDAGYLGLDWPAEYGGKGDPLKRQRIVSQELSRAGAPSSLVTRAQSSPAGRPARRITPPPSAAAVRS